MPEYIFDPSPINIRFDLDASGSVGAIGRLAQSFALTGKADGGAQFAATIRPFSIEATSTVGAVGHLNIVLGRTAFSLSATGGQEEYGRAEVVAPLFRSVFGVYRDTMPLFSLRGIGQEELVGAAEYLAYAINTKNAALTEYTNFPFNHIVYFEGETIAFLNDGAVILGGDLDDATEIDSVAELSPGDFDTSRLKRMPYGYIGAKTDDKIRVTMVGDEGSVATVAALTATNGRNRRAKLARGPKARYWAARIENINGENFAVDSVEYLPMVLRRKV
ncbi:MAG: hypothetical protein DRQ39_07005 [Gammaproteobacteria bacterium]|nr:MAG: hypothetical protein DRQ39_07005 [Gammaproteobacteria bacterium]